MHTQEKNISDKLKNEVENVVATVESRADEAILYAMDDLVMSRMELAMRPVGVSRHLTVAMSCWILIRGIRWVIRMTYR